MEFNSVTWSAPALIMASAPREATTGMVDVTLALSYFELAAPKLGLGTCWAGLVSSAMKTSSAVREAIGLPTACLLLQHAGRVSQNKIYARSERKAPKIAWH